MPKINDRQTREARKSEARARASFVSTPAQQLEKLNDRLGFGVGARKERERLAALLQA